MAGLLDWTKANPAFFQGLLGAGQAMIQAGAPSPYPQSFLGGLGMGGAGFASGVDQYRKQEAEEKERKRLEEERDRAQRDETARRESLNRAIQGLPESQRAFASAFPEQFASQYAKNEFGAPEAPKTAGGMYYDAASQSWKQIPGYVEQQRASRAGPAPQRLSLDATYFDPKQNAYVYATGPLTGKIAKPGSEKGDTQPSAFSEKLKYWEDSYKAAGDPDWKRKAGIAAQASNADQIPPVTEFEPLPEDPDDLEDGLYYTHPTYGRVKYLGNGQFEQLE